MRSNVGVALKEKAEPRLVKDVKRPQLRLISKKTIKAENARKAYLDNLILEHRENGRKLARSLLRRWHVHMPPEETDSIVDLTLCEAAARYSAERGASFITFLFYHLRGHLVRAVVAATNVSNIFLASAMNSGVEINDWSVVKNDVGRSMLSEHTAHNQQELENPEQLIIRKENIEICQEAMKKLDDLEKEIITRSFAQDEALVDIAQELGYSRCHISRVKKRALERLKAELTEARGEGEKTIVAEESMKIEKIVEAKNTSGSKNKTLKKRATLIGVKLTRHGRRRRVMREKLNYMTISV